MKGESNIIKIIACFLIVGIITSMSASNTYAVTQGQKLIGDIGTDITWYNFPGCTNYYINSNDETGTYSLTMLDKNDDTSKTAFVNSKGEIVLEPEDYESIFSSYSDGIIVAKKGGSYKYIDSTGVKEIKGEDYSKIGDFNNGYASVTLKSNLNKGIIDKNGTLIFEDKEGKYKDFSFLNDGIFSAEINEDTYDLIDLKGNHLNENSYSWIFGVSEGTIAVIKDEKYGFLDFSGKEIIPAIYDQATPFNEGLAGIYKNGKWGFIDKSGKEVISPNYDEVYYFNNGLATVYLDKKWGLIDKAGNIIFPIECDYPPRYENGFFIANKGNKSFMLDSSGKIIDTKDYSYYYKDSNNLIYVEKVLNGVTVGAYLDENENMLTGFKEFFLYYLSDKLYLGEKSGEYPEGVVPPHDYDQRFALFDSEGNNLTGFKYENRGDFFNNFQVVYKYYYDEVGLVNQYGAEVLPTIFDDILLTNAGYAFVTIRDPNTGENSRVGYFKIPDSFSNIKNVNKPITVYLDGTELYFDIEPTIKNQKTMIPVRKIFESLGSKVEWNSSTKTVTASKDSKNLSLTIGSDIAYVNGTKMQLDTAPFIQDGITLVPLRFVSENLGADVKWDGSLRRIIITSK
ncbi:WG repeat-containing protein [Anaerovorax odorimutans]|uniref:WG repeat-containing protein n=1 Tax=Anaerovorax odorimutans TaxID=109327 RepID=UPI00040E29A4|nr:WG repeat-containing protein [Anaerovorax odorimutans]